MNDRDIAIRIGAAGNQAANVLSGLVTPDTQMDYIAGVYEHLLGEFVRIMNTAEAEMLVEAAMPGTTQVPTQTNVIPFTPPATAAPAPAAPAPAPAPAPVPVPGAGDGDARLDALWREFFADPSQWYDNRRDKRTPNSPDFKHKTKKTPDGKYNLGLYADDKKNPSWVADGLRQLGG
jgi:hypothetical protein